MILSRCVGTLLASWVFHNFEKESPQGEMHPSLRYVSPVQGRGLAKAVDGVEADITDRPPPHAGTGIRRRNL